MQDTAQATQELFHLDILHAWQGTQTTQDNGVLQEKAV